MKNTLILLFTLAILLVSILGCSYYNPLESSTNSTANDNRAMSDKVIDSTIGEEKLGIPECDEVIDFFAAQQGSPDEDFVTKAAREFALNKVKENFKRAIEENKNDKAALAQNCRQFKTQLDRFKTEETNKNSSNKAR